MKIATIAALLLMMVGCTGAEPDPDGEATVYTRVGASASVYTVIHDEHRFVLGCGSGTALLHHPSCPCLEDQ